MTEAKSNLKINRMRWILYEPHLSDNLCELPKILFQPTLPIYATNMAHTNSYTACVTNHKGQKQVGFLETTQANE